MKYLIILFFSLLLLSCEKDESIDFLKGPWVVSTLKNIELYTRPNNFSTSKSPDSTTINSVLIDQNSFIDTINKRLHINCTSKFKIYLFNRDEAKDLIGTNTGGYANPKDASIYYTFFEKPFFYPDMNLYSYLGLHELVHLITYDAFGLPKNRMMIEGYAVAIENSYGGHFGNNGEMIRTMNRDWMKIFVANNSILTPNELLEGNYIPEGTYYPQVGTFINWLFDRFGVEQINKLYMVDKQDFKRRFRELFNIEYDDIEKDYLEFCKKEFK